MRTKLRPLSAIGISLALVVSGCSNPGTDGGGGGVSGSVVWYTSQNPEQNDAVIAGFNAEYPDVQVEVLRLVTGELSVRYAQERESGASVADVVTLADGAMLDEGASRDWWETDVAPAEGFPEDGMNDGIATVGILPLLVGYNTDRLVGDAAPDEWRDLLEPDLKGQILFADPRNVPAYLALAQIWSDEYGDEFLSALADQNLQMVSSIVPANEALGAGGASVLVPNARPAATTLIDAGAPVGLAEIGPTTGSEYYTVIPSDTKNPEAAEAFFEYLTSKSGQEEFTGELIVSLREDAETGELPEDFIPLNEVLPAANERRKELLDLLRIQ
ncbi:extracellular solute-binding protein [Citricoccus sp. NPDC055426]|uniref:extracellular solute-binding protein n=1 Tax=Citricoccus sp. NPDC055426 TaxID=3155536 RepID=UPI0034475298